jgi:hypothetical protein
MKNIRLCLLGLLFCTSTIGLGQTIFSLHISPNAPNPSNTVLLFAQASFPYTGCAQTSSLLSINQNTLVVYSWHTMGLAAAICNFTDTISLGQLPPGNYMLIYNLINTTNQASDSDTLNFIVSGFTENQENLAAAGVYKVFPNPTGSGAHFSIQEWNEVEGIQLYNALGVRTDSKRTFAQNAYIDLSDQKAGVYFLRIKHSGKEWTSKLVKVESE